MISRPSFRAVATALLVVCFASAPAASQVLYGSLIGNVRDPTGAAVPGATVTIINSATNQSRQATTNDTGMYNFATVQSGVYSITVAKSGFRPFTQTKVNVSINTVSRIDVTLQIGPVTESVQVNSEAVLLQTDRSEVSKEVSTKTLQDTPLPPGRNYQQLLRTVPGITPPTNAHSVPSNPSRSLQYHVNGTSASSNDVRVDGASQYNIWLPHITAYTPALESIETVNVVTNSFDAEQGLAGGSTISVQIKSGTNRLHGSAFEYHNDNVLEAKPFFLPAGQRNPKDIFNQYGGTLGGPFKKDKLFWFVSYEGSPIRQFASRFVTVPTQAIRNGDMSESSRPIYDPATGNPDGSKRTAFPNNIVPRSRFEPIVADKIIPLIPLPNIPGDLLTNNYFAQGSFAYNRNTLDTKVNWNATNKFNMYTRLSVLRYDMHDPQVFGDLGGPPVSGFGGNPGHGFGGTYSATVAGTYVLSPSFIIDANFGYTLMDTNVEQPLLDKKIGRDVLGIPGTNGPRRFEGGWPRFQISNYTTIGINEDYMPYFRHDPQFNYVANANWTKGTHNVRFGIDVSHQDLNQTQPEFTGANHGAQGGFNFSGGVTGLKNGPSPNQFNSFAAFLLGLPSNTGRILLVPDMFTTRTWEYSLYIRDQWQITPKLTVNYGTRWEYFPMPTRGNRGLERYDFDRNKMLACGVGSIPEDCGVAMTKLGFAPRVGFAYRATDTFVIRAGYGITNDPYNLARPLRTNYPELIPFNVDAPNSFQPEGLLRNGIPAIPVPSLGNGIIDIPGRVAVNTLGKDFTRGYIQSWNFTVQKQLYRGFVGQAGYVATRSTKQLGYLEQNYGTIDGGIASEVLNRRFGRTARTALVTPVGNSKYDSLQTSLDRRFANGIQLNFAYTFSKATGIAGVSNSDNSPRIQIPQYYDLNRALLDYDRTHDFQATFIAELPFGRGKRMLHNGGIAAAIAGGWQVNGIFSRYSGSPFSVSASGASLNAPGATQRADQVKPHVKILGGTGPGQSYFDPFAFAPVTAARFGTAGFNTLRGPGTTNLDLGLFRSFKITERWGLQFRAEAFNATNTPHFANPGTNVSSLVLNPDESIKRLSGYTEITSTTGTGREGVDQRVFRLGLRVSF